MKTNCLMLFTEIVIVYSLNHTKHMSTICGQNADISEVKADVTYSNQIAWKGYM
jgi:hypothetical protein